MYKIEKNIPLPIISSSVTEITQTLKSLEIGDSFHVPFIGTSNKDKQLYKNRVTASLYYFKAKHKYFKYATRTDSDKQGMRIWRIK